MNYGAFERGQNLNARERFNKENKEELYKLALMIGAILANIYYFPQANIGCNFDATKLNRAFLLWVVSIDTALRIACLFFWNSTYLLNERNNVLKIS